MAGSTQIRLSLLYSSSIAEPTPSSSHSPLYSSPVANESTEESLALVNPMPNTLSSTNLSTSPLLQASPQKLLVKYGRFKSSSIHSAMPKLPQPHPPQNTPPTSSFILASQQVASPAPKSLHSLSISHASSPACVTKSEPSTFSTNSSLVLGLKNANH